MASFVSFNMSMVAEKVKDGADPIMVLVYYLFLALLCFLSWEALAG
jgi:hypothetical protein